LAGLTAAITPTVGWRAFAAMTVFHEASVGYV
jgi:hypothetical protein